MWYMYNQNNSWGKLVPPAIAVIVFADNQDGARTKAEGAGVYFDGPDCPCCGPRWSQHDVDTYSTESAAIADANHRYASWTRMSGVKTLVVVK